jgi:hypothetical protein
VHERLASTKQNYLVHAFWDRTKRNYLVHELSASIKRNYLVDFGRSKIDIIDHNPSWKENQRQKRESFWIRELQTLHPEGIRAVFKKKWLLLL